MRHVTGRISGLAAILAALAGCVDGTPTSDDPGLLPVDAETVEIRLSFDEFARDFQVFSGFGSAAEFPRPWVAHRYRDELDARALIRFGALPPSVTVAPPGGGDPQVDSTYVPVQGTMVLFFDTLSAVGSAPWPIEIGATETPWHLTTARWNAAVDTLGSRVDWPEAGGGPVRHIWSGEWDPVDGDSIVVPIDSLTVSELANQSLTSRGLRIETTGEGSRLRILGATFRVDVRSSINPELLVEVQAQGFNLTFLYSPEAPVDPGAVQFGGVPARRSYLRLDLPSHLNPNDPDFCAIAECPVRLTADRLLYAGLVLETAEVTPPIFAPSDTITFDVRPVLSPERLPRSPLGSPVQALGSRIPPAAFQPGGARRVEVPVTRYVRDLLRGPPEGQQPLSPVLAVLSVAEPATLEVASFSGPSGASPPVLRLILTITEGVTLP